MAFPAVDRSLLPMKAHYFLFNAGSAPIVPFLPTYARQLGFSPLVVGIIYFILPIFGMLSKPIFGAVADYFKRQKSIFLSFQVIIAVSLFLIQFLPEVPTLNTVELHCHQETNLAVCNPYDSKAADVVAAESNLNGTVLCHLTCDVSNKDMYHDLCADWRLLQYCNSSNIEQEGRTVIEYDASHPQDYKRPTVLEMYAEINMQRHERVGNCTFLRVHNARMLDNSPHVAYCEALQVLNCNATCNSASVMELITRPVLSDTTTSTYQFWLFLLLLIVAWSGMAVVASVGDTICFGMLGNKPNMYGRQRLWGAVGWGSFTLIAGFLVDEFSQGQVKKDYTVVFYLVLINLAFSIIVSYKLKYTQTNISRNIFKDVGLKLSEVRILIFMLWCLVVGMNTALLWQFLFWHLESLAGSNGVWNKTLQGLASGVQCFGGELPLFFLSGWIIKRLGHIHVMTLVLFSFGVRFILYALLSNPWWCLPIELFQGVTFGLFYSTMASYASIVSPPGTEATVQGLVGAVFEGVGVSLGSLLSGALINVYSGAVVFGMFGSVSILLAIVHGAVQFFLSHAPPSSSKGFETVLYAPPNEANDAVDDQQVLTAG